MIIYFRLNCDDFTKLANRIISLFPKAKKEIYYIPSDQKKTSTQRKGSGGALQRAYERFRDRLDIDDLLDKTTRNNPYVSGSIEGVVICLLFLF